MTPLVKRIVAEKRWPLLTLLAVLTANVIGYVLVVRPLAASSAGADTRATTAAAAVIAAEREHAAAEALMASKGRADEELETFYEQILPANATAARRLTYASLPALAGRANTQYLGRRFEIAEMEQDSRLGQMTIRMELQGQYEDLRQFIYEVERAPGFLIIDEITLTEQDAEQPLALVVGLSTYFRARGQ
jgi:hypothetical protein